ncbi:MAG: response regulator [Proteobacteria bacterium]|nr:response regulator [Pseudomonadota bacterium]
MSDLKQIFKNVLIIDRDESMQNIVKRYLANLGILKPDCVDDGVMGLDKVRQKKYDLVIFDIKMKKPPGLELYDAIRKNESSSMTSLILIAGSITKSEIDICLKDPLAKLLAKPFTEDVFSQLIKKFAKDLPILQKQVESTKSSDLNPIPKHPDSPQEIIISSQESNQNPQKSSSDKSDHSLATPNSSMVAGDRKLDLDSNANHASIQSLANNKETKSSRPLDLDQHTVSQIVPRKILLSSQLFGMKVDTYRPETVLIVDSDLAMHGLLKSYLKGVSDSSPLCLTDGTEAKKNIAGSNFDLVIMDWKLKGTSGLGLYNRIRYNSPNSISPVMVLSGLIHKEDARILLENQATSFVEKPLNKTNFEQALKAVLTNAAEIKFAYKYLAEELDSKKLSAEGILSLADNVEKNQKDPSTLLNIMVKLLMARGSNKIAEVILQKILQKDKSNIAAMTELSKIYHRTGRGQKAADLLKSASHLSPGSIERLCLMGEIDLTLKNATSAKNFFKEALELDDGHPTANAGMTLATNFIEKGEEIKNSAAQEGDSSLAAQFASSLNTVAIAYIKDQNIIKAIEQYQAATCFVYDSETLSKLHFNLGLASLRNQDPQTALKWFQSSKNLGGVGYSKPNKYIDLILAKKQINLKSIGED